MNTSGDQLNKLQQKQDLQQPLPSQQQAAQVQAPVQMPTSQSAQKTQTEPQVGRPVGDKEAEYVSDTSSVGEAEKVPIVEMKEPGELPTEVEGWIERAEKDDVAEPPTIVHQGQTVVSPASPQNVSVTLPLDDAGIKKGLTRAISESIRWLAEWSKRILMKLGGKVGFK